MIAKKTFLQLLFVFLFLLIFSQFTHANNPYLIFHLDAVSSEVFYRELEDGNLPNIEEIFEGGNMIRYGLTLFPGGTEVIVPRLPYGYSNAENPLVGWSFYDAKEERVVNDLEVFLKKFREIPRINRANYIHGIPGLDFLAGLSIYNIPALLEDYAVLEFYYFVTDSVGHIFGEKKHLEKLHQFDRYLGKLNKKMDLRNVNIVLYSDHGMVYNDVYTIDTKYIMDSDFAEYIKYYHYPNLYLKNNYSASEIANLLASKGIFDIVLYRKNACAIEDQEVIGYTEQGKLKISSINGKFSYQYTADDYFSYYEEGYNGEYLDSYQWLDLTRDSRYPGAIVNLYNYMLNPNTGDIVTILNPPKQPKTVDFYKGNHTGITSEDLLIPILYKGPDLEELYDIDALYLHKLYTEIIPESKELRRTPEREKHSISFISNGDSSDLHFSLSPAYRTKLDIKYSNDTQSIAYHYDLFTSFLTRVWLGPALINTDSNCKLTISLQTEIKIDRLSLLINRNFFFDESTKLSLVYDLNNDFSIIYSNTGKFGLRYEF
ncbi:alkaline phosphatase family protein [Natronospora cellulosivora (SeqCode)]